MSAEATIIARRVDGSRPDDFDRLVAPIYAEARGRGPAAAAARVKLEGMRTRLDDMLAVLNRGAARTLADWAKIRLLAVKYGEVSSGDSAADLRIRKLGPLGLDTLNAWIVEGRKLIRRDCNGAGQNPEIWAAVNKAGKTAFDKVFPKKKQRAVELMQKAEDKAARGLALPTNFHEYYAAIEELQDVKRAMLTAALKEYGKEAKRVWLASKGGKRGKFPPR